MIPEQADQAANRKERSGGGRPVGHDATDRKERNTVDRAVKAGPQ